MKLLKSKAGFTLIELLVVIGILAVLAAIAIPSVAGLIDRANVSADNTNCNEMTNAIERFTSEYELYCQDIASGVIKDVDSNGVPDDMDGAQGRVFNVTKAMTRANITALESTGLGDRQINRDTKYPTNLETLKAIVENYTKTSSATFEPKQSDCSFYYSPDCGVVVCAPTDATVAQLNALILSGKDAKGNTLGDTTNWDNVTNSSVVNEGGSPVTQTFTFTINLYKQGTFQQSMTYTCESGFTWKEWKTQSDYYDGCLDAVPNDGDDVSIIWGAGLLIENENQNGCPKYSDTIIPNGVYELHNGHSPNEPPLFD